MGSGQLSMYVLYNNRSNRVADIHVFIVVWKQLGGSQQRVLQKEKLSSKLRMIDVLIQQDSKQGITS